MVAYYRVSTQKQGRSGLGLDAQRKAVAAFAQVEGFDIISPRRTTGARSFRQAIHHVNKALVRARLRSSQISQEVPYYMGYLAIPWKSLRLLQHRPPEAAVLAPAGSARLRRIESGKQ